MQMNNIQDILHNRILVLDGAMGTMIQRYELAKTDFHGKRFASHPVDLTGNNDVLNLTRPDVIQEIHRAYLEAGSDIIETNTFNATSVSQADYGMETYVYEMNREGARIAREAADEFSKRTPEKPRFVAGSVGPTSKTLSISPDVTDPGFRAISFDQLKEAYVEQVRGLIEGGVDLILIETVFDTLNAKSALVACEEIFERSGRKVPVMVSGTITDASGRTLSGQTTEAFLISLEHVELLSIGLNCALGAPQLEPYVEILGKRASIFTSAHPNAGLPNEFGEYDESPDRMREHIRPYMEKKLVNIIGGCCGTTPDHIRELAALARNYEPRKIVRHG